MATTNDTLGKVLVLVDVEAVKAIRTAIAAPAATFARRCGLTADEYLRLETPAVRGSCWGRVRLSHVERVAVALGTTVDVFMAWVGPTISDDGAIRRPNTKGEP
jgi:hypothetical protein